MERGVLARALYTNTPEAKTELYFRKGDVVTVIEFDYENQPGWWLCSLRGQRGICPGNYFELLEDKYSIPQSPITTTANNRGGSNSSSLSLTSTGNNPKSRESDTAVHTLIDDPLETYDVPRGSYNHHNPHHPQHQNHDEPSSKVGGGMNPLEFYDVPRSHIPLFPATSMDSLARTKNRQSELSLLSTGSSAHLSSSASSSTSSSSASSSARSSANCDLTPMQGQHEHDSFFQVTPSPRENSSTLQVQSDSPSPRQTSTGVNNPEKSSSPSSLTGLKSKSQSQGNIHQIQPTNGTTLSSHPRQNNYNRSSIQSETIMSMAPLQELYDVPRSAPSSRAQSSMSMSSGLGLSIANSDSKDSLDYDVPRSSGGVVAAYVNHLETKYDNPSVSNSCRNSCCSMTNSYGNTSSSSSSAPENPVGHLPPSGHEFNGQVKGSPSPSRMIENGRVSATPPGTSSSSDDLYDVPRPSVPPVVVRKHPRHPFASSTSLAASNSMSMSKESLRSSHRRLNNGSSCSNMGSSSLELRRRGIIQNAQSTDTLSTFPMTQRFNSSQYLNQHRHSSDDVLDFDLHDGGGPSLDTSMLSLQSFGNRTMTPRSSFCSVRSDSFDTPGKGQVQERVEDVKFLPLNPRAAVTVCEKLRQEVITSINSIQNFVKPKWRSVENLTEIMPDLRFSCVRFNLAIKDMTDFCSRCLSNSKKFTIEALVTKLQRLLTPLINGSQIIQRDVDELEAYFWSVDRLSQSPQTNKNLPPDCLDQLVLCARSLQHDVTEIANFLALNSSALFREAERLNPPQPQTNPVVTEISNNGDGPIEDYDYVSLMPMDQVDGPGSSSSTREEELGACSSSSQSTPANSTPYLVPSDQQLLEFYSTQIAATAPLLSQSISTFINSIQQNDTPKTFNGHLKYVILLAYKMLFVGDTVHRNILNVEIKEEVETKANELHKSVVSLHEASRIASQQFPRIPPMQNIVDRVWETTAAATQLKKVMINAACF